MRSTTWASSRTSLRRRGDEGFTRFEFVVVLALITTLVLVISFSFSRVTADAVKSTCASNVASVDQAKSSFSSLHAPGTQLTVASLTTTGPGTLTSWPKAPGHAYLIVIAGDENHLVGQLDARGIRIQRNDILVIVGTQAYDATRSFASACAAV